MALFATGVKRPYYVREIARHVNERLNAVRRELDILRKIGMLETYDEKRRKYYTVNPNFVLLEEIASIMQKAGPGIDDALFRNMDKLGDVRYACLSGFFTNAKDSPTDLLLVGDLDEVQLNIFVKRIEKQMQREVTYTPMTESEYRYRRNFNDIFLRQIFMYSHKELINKLSGEMQPSAPSSRSTASIIRPAV